MYYNISNGRLITEREYNKLDLYERGKYKKQETAVSMPEKKEEDADESSDDSLSFGTGALGFSSGDSDISSPDISSDFGGFGGGDGGGGGAGGDF